MSDKRPATDGDRLPWLGPLPDRNPAPGPRAAVRGLTILVILLTVALTGTLSLLLLRDRDAPTTATITQPATLPAQPAAKIDLPARPVAPPPTAPTPGPPATLAEAPAPAAKPKAPVKQVRKSTKSVKKARSKKRTATARRASSHPVKVHRGTRKTWPSVARGRGRVIQLGAYNSAGQAYNAWLGTVRDYPYLGTLPRRITPIRIGPNRRLYYRLQVATPSRRHAEPICRVVRATGRACMVRR